MKFTVDLPDLIDAVRRAASVAPNTGEQAGVRLEVQGALVLVKAADAETTFRAQIPLRSSEGIIDPFRLPASVLAAYLQKLPLVDDPTVELVVGAEEVRLTSGKCRATFNRIKDTGGYRTIEAFDPSGLAEVEGLASKLQRVVWARHPKDPPYDGIHLSGTYIETTDKYKMARVACEIPLDRPVTAPLTATTEAMRGYKGGVHLGVHNDKLMVMPDPDLQFTSVVYMAPWPPTENVYNIVRGNPRQTFNKAGLLDALSRIVALSKEQASPKVTATLDGAMLLMEITVPGIGNIEEKIDLDSESPTKFNFAINPITWSKALEAGEGEVITVGWPDDGGKNKPMYMTDGREYESAIALIRA